MALFCVLGAFQTDRQTCLCYSYVYNTIFVTFAPFGVLLNQVIVVLNHFQCDGLEGESNFLMIDCVSVVSRLLMLVMFGADMIVPFGLAPRIAVPEQQYHQMRTTVLVQSGGLDASFPNHTPLAIVPRSFLQSVRRRSMVHDVWREKCSMAFQQFRQSNDRRFLSYGRLKF